MSYNVKEILSDYWVRTELDSYIVTWVIYTMWTKREWERKDLSFIDWLNYMINNTDPNSYL